MASLIFTLYLILVAIWLLMSIAVFIFTVRHHPLSITNWVVIVLYVIISFQIFAITFGALTRYVSLRALLPV
ncbi:MAG: hypothetical protein AAB855_02220 [Patescibacteria group bacterium]